jgi:hypothetical protein
MTRSETFLGNKNAKALPSVPLGFRLREQVRPGLCEHHVAAGRMQREPAMCDCGFHGQAIFLIAATGIYRNIEGLVHRVIKVALDDVASVAETAARPIDRS